MKTNKYYFTIIAGIAAIIYGIYNIYHALATGIINGIRDGGTYSYACNPGSFIFYLALHFLYVITFIPACVFLFLSGRQGK